MAWLLDEDEALKAKVSGLTVTDYGTGVVRQVPVFFRFPDTEIRQQRKYPHLAIDLIRIDAAPDRTHRAVEFFPPQYVAEGVPASAYDYPLPWSLIYQIGAFSRDPVHDRQLTGSLYQLFPNQFGFLDMQAIDGTIRRADLTEVARQDSIDSTQNRLFTTAFTVAVSSEFLLGTISEVAVARQISLIVEPYVGSALP